MAFFIPAAIASAAVVFSGGDIQKKKKCRQRCDSWFSLQPGIKDGCRRYCNSGITEFTKEEYLCAGIGPNQEDVMRVYGYDPCPGRGPGLEDFTDPFGERKRQAEKEDANRVLLANILIVTAAIVVFALAGFFLIKSK